MKLYQQALTEFKKDKTSAIEFAGAKNKDQAPRKSGVEVVANAMLNLDEVITKN